MTEERIQAYARELAKVAPDESASIYSIAANLCAVEDALRKVVSCV